MAKNKNVVAVNEKMLQGGNVGAIVWWVLNGTVSYNKLIESLTASGLEEKLMPPPITADCALRRAAKAQEERRFLARPLGRGIGWAMVQERSVEDSDGESLTHEVVCKVKLTDTEQMVATPADHPVAAHVRADYEAARDAYTPQDVSAWVVRVADSLRCLRLRERGGVYFVPSDALPVWKGLCSAIREAHGGHDLYEVPAMRSEEAVKAILDAVVREAEEEAAQMRTDMTEGDLGGKALNGRADKVSDIKAKVAHYEELLGVTQTALREKLDTLRADLTAAALLAMDDGDVAA